MEARGLRQAVTVKSRYNIYRGTANCNSLFWNIVIKKNLQIYPPLQWGHQLMYPCWQPHKMQHANAHCIFIWKHLSSSFGGCKTSAAAWTIRCRRWSDSVIFLWSYSIVATDDGAMPRPWETSICFLPPSTSRRMSTLSCSKNSFRFFLPLSKLIAGSLRNTIKENNSCTVIQRTQYMLHIKCV